MQRTIVRLRGRGWGAKTGAMALAAVAAVAAAATAGPAAGTTAAHGTEARISLAADDGPSSPTLTFTNAAARSTLGQAYSMALKNLLTTNTVPYDAAT